MKLDLRSELISNCHETPFRVNIELISEVWEGSSQAAKGPSGPTLGDPVFSRIAASEGASHASEITLSSASLSVAVFSKTDPGEEDGSSCSFHME